MKYRLTVNGDRREIDVAPDTPLLWVLRDDLALTGTKYSCGIAQCGACTVHLDGRSVRSCVTPMSAVEKREVTTIEGIEGPIAAAVQTAWDAIQVPQCGYCQSGQIMTVVALLDRKPDPSDDDIDGSLAGNVCRCATYPRIRQAIHEAAAKLEG